MKRIFAAALAALLALAFCTTPVLAADALFQNNAKNSFYTVENLQRYYNAIIVSSSNSAVEDYVLGQIVADLGDDGFYYFTYEYPNGSVMEGKVDKDGNIHGLGVSAKIDTANDVVLAKYVLFATIAGIQFKDTAAVTSTSDILSKLDIDVSSNRFGDSRTTEYTKNFIVYKLTIDQANNKVYLSMVSALTA